MAAEGIKTVDVQRSEIDLQRLVHVAEGNAQGGRLGPVEIQEKLRRICAELGRDTHQPWLLRQLSDEGVGLPLQGWQSQAALVLDDELEAASDAQARDRRRPEEQDLRVFYLLGPCLAEAVYDYRIAKLGAAAFLERFQDDKHRAKVRAGGLLDERITGHGDGVRHTGDAGVVFAVVRVTPSDLHGCGEYFLGAVQRRRVGKLNVGDHPALILLWDKARRGLAEHRVGQGQERCVDQQDHDVHA